MPRILPHLLRLRGPAAALTPILMSAAACLCLGSMAEAQPGIGPRLRDRNSTGPANQQGERRMRNTQPPPQVAAGREDGQGWRRGRGGWTTSSRALMRDAFLAEVRESPELGNYFGRLMEIHGERIERYRRRESLMRERVTTDALLKEFHELLEADNRLSAEQQRLTERIVEDASQVLAILAARREQIRGKLEMSPQSRTPEEDARLRRAIRIYDALSDGLARLRENPEDSEWVRRVLQGRIPTEDVSPQVAEMARRRLQRAEQDLDDLRRRVMSLTEEMQDLRDLVELSGPSSPERIPAVPRPAPGRPGRPAPPAPR